MFKPVVLAVTCALVVNGVPINKQPRFKSNSEAASRATLSRAEQTVRWHKLEDKHLNSKGFVAWKPTKAGFLLKNSDFQVACFSSLQTRSVSCGQPMPQEVIEIMHHQRAISLLEKRSSTTSRVFSTSGLSKAAITVGDEYTPMMHKNMQALNPKVSYEHESESTSGVTWGNGDDKYKIDDEVDEGEVDNSDLDPEVESPLDIGMMRRMLDHLDAGPGGALDEENERDTQVVTTRKATVNGAKGYSAIHHSDGQHNSRAGLLDVPYVDAGIDRIVNERMFQFFKKHPQYHTSSAHHLTAERWQKWMAMSGEESQIMGGQSGAQEANHVGSGDATDMGQTGPGVGIWQKSCPENVPKKWPDTPRIKCKHFAVSPLGFWGCAALFEDGTCSKPEFYEKMAWDGLDAYPIPKGNPDAEKGEQYHDPNAWQNEILPGGNAVNHDYYTSAGFGLESKRVDGTDTF